MPIKKYTKHAETVGPSGCVEFFPQVEHKKPSYDCVNGTWIQKTGMPSACNPKSKFASDQWNYSYECYPPTGRYRHIPGTPIAPRKTKKSGSAAAPKAKGVKRGPSSFNIFFSTVMERPEFKDRTDRKQRFADAMAQASREWKGMMDNQKAEYKALAAETKAVYGVSGRPSVPAKLKTEFF